MPAVIDGLNCSEGVVQVTVRVTVAIADASIQWVILFLLFAKIPLLSHKVGARLFRSVCVGGVFGGNQRHQAEGCVVIGQALAGHIDAAVFLLLLQDMSIGFLDPDRLGLGFLGVGVKRHQAEGRNRWVVRVKPVSILVLALLQKTQPLPTGCAVAGWLPSAIIESSMTNFFMIILLVRCRRGPIV